MAFAIHQPGRITNDFFFHLIFELKLAQTKHSESLAVFVITTIEIFYAFGNLGVACEIGQRIMIAFDECSEMVNQFSWYLFPREIQRMLPMILNFTQQPVEIIHFGSKASDQGTFKSVREIDRIPLTLLEISWNH